MISLNLPAASSANSVSYTSSDLFYIHTYTHTYISKKEVKYIELISLIQNLSNSNTLSIVVVVVGAMGTITKILDRNLQKIFPDNNNINIISHRIQKAAVLGTLTVSKIPFGM